MKNTLKLVTNNKTPLVTISSSPLGTSLTSLFNPTNSPQNNTANVRRIHSINNDLLRTPPSSEGLRKKWPWRLSDYDRDTSADPLDEV